MRKLLPSTFFLLSLAFLFTNCRKENFQAYYGRPDGLAPPIYQQLEARGNFKHLLSYIDKAGYKETLSSTGYWTLFAPNDAAFEKFFQENNIPNDKIDSVAKAIVKYNLVFNSYRKDQLSIYQTTKGTGSGLGEAFKRKTTYYEWVQAGNEKYKNVIATNRNNTTRTSGSATGGSTTVNTLVYVDGDNNNKYIPYFTDEFFATNALTSADYKFFYPNSTYSGFNVAAASVVNKDIAAENGMIHEVDRVILPLKSLDHYLSSNENYSEFKKLLDSLSYYTANVGLTNRNFILSGSSDSVYVKSYDGRLAFSPNNENYQEPGLASFSNTAGQKNSWTLLAPTNAVFNAYRKKILSKYGNSFFKGAPSSVLIDFLNAHMFSKPLWPGNFKSGLNFPGEPTTMELSDVVDKQMLSNGLFYGISKVQEANVFRTLYGIPYLDPGFNMTYKAYSDLSTNIKITLTQPLVKHTLLLMSDQVLAAAGWRYNESSAGTGTTPWGYKPATSSSYSHSTAYRETILRILKSGVFITYNDEMNNLGGQGIAEALNGEYIKWNNNKIETSGTVDQGIQLNVIKRDDSALNGPAYFIDGPLTFSEKNVGQHIEDLAAKYPTIYGSFNSLLQLSNIYNKTTKAIQGVNSGADYNYTILAPSNAAISDAVKRGWLPGNTSTGALPSTAPTAEAQKDQIRKFILYHIINGATIAADGKKSDRYLTLLQNEKGDNLLVDVNNSPGNMVIADRSGDVASVNISVSNQLSSRTLIHSINSFLKY